MKIYIAADHEDPAFAHSVAEQLSSLGHQVVSTWHSRELLTELVRRARCEAIIAVCIADEHDGTVPVIQQPEAERQAQLRYADCKTEIASSDVMLVFTESDSGWQAVLAEQYKIPVIVVGPRNQPCFFSKQVVYSCDTLDHAFESIAEVSGAPIDGKNTKNTKRIVNHVELDHDCWMSAVPMDDHNEAKGQMCAICDKILESKTV